MRNTARLLARVSLVAVAALLGRATSPSPFAASAADADTIAERIVVTGRVTDASTGGGVAMANVLAITGSARPYVSADTAGQYALTLTGVTRGSTIRLLVRRIGYNAREQDVRLTGDTVRVDFALAVSTSQLSTVVVTGEAQERMVYANTVGQQRSAASDAQASATTAVRKSPATVATAAAVVPRARHVAPPAGFIADAPGRGRGTPTITRLEREQYARIEDNPFRAAHDHALSTFSIDVDRASYSNVRRFINSGQTPPPDAVRIEEMVNYFPYRLDAPRGRDPIAITTEIAPAPWQPRHQLVRIALQARAIDTHRLPPNNLVFLIDVSGSMQMPNKLPLVKQSLRLLVQQMREQDHIALVVYAGNAGLVLPPTSGERQAEIIAAIDRLEAGGSTAGGAGLELAYRTARAHFLPEGNNRVILATDGDFNVGPSSDAAMTRLVEAQRASGTYLTVLGFGTGNLQDTKMEAMAKVGNGNYAYIDDLAEARKVLVRELGATLVTVANDVKLQIEFNPKAVSAYRLIGYENRLLQDEDFADDRKDAADVGAGHTVTALYEVVPAGVTGTVTLRDVGERRYDAPASQPTRASRNELLFVQLRYKIPGEDVSSLMTRPVRTADAKEHSSDDFRFAAAVASFGMLLRDSEHKGSATPEQVLALARGAEGDDQGGYRAEFVRLVERWRMLGDRHRVTARP